MSIDVLRFYGARRGCGNANSRPAADESRRLSHSRDDGHPRINEARLDSLERAAAAAIGAAARGKSSLTLLIWKLRSARPRAASRL